MTSAATATWQINKAVVRSANGVVAAQSRLAAEAGARVLAGGGNAVDAAVTTAFALGVVEPWLSGIGGGGFLVAVDREGNADALDFNVRAPAGLDASRYRLRGGKDGDWFDWPAVADDLNVSGYQSICVPGSVAGLAEALRKLGTISFAEALGPAIAYADQGLTIDWYSALAIAMDAASLARFPTSAALFLDDGFPPRVPDRGKLVRPMHGMAMLLKRLAEAGAQDFYRGEIAAALLRDLSVGGNAITQDDLAGYEPRWLPPLRTTYRGRTLYAVPGLRGGPRVPSGRGVHRGVHRRRRLRDDVRPRVHQLGRLGDGWIGGAHPRRVRRLDVRDALRRLSFAR